MRQADVRWRPAKINGHPYFCVTWPKPGGGRDQQHFKNRSEAIAFYDQKKIERARFGSETELLSGRETRLFREWEEILKPYGKTIADAITHYTAHLKTNENSCTARELVDRLLEAKAAAGLSELHIRDIRCRLNVFAEKFNGRPVSEITSGEINSWLMSLPHSMFTRNRYRALTVMAYKFAIRNGFATNNPAAGGENGKVVAKPPGILTVEQTARLLNACPPDVLPYVAIGAFAGLRAAEIQRLDWAQVDLESALIEVKAEICKTGQRRLVKIEPCLRAWLLPHRKSHGPVAPSSSRLRKALQQASKAAGIAKWPSNALRHSCASYMLARDENAPAVALQLGHDVKVLMKHYRELVKPVDAARYWKITPCKT